MNIFFLHLRQRTCARYHADKHVIKMILETCQLLCSAHHMSNTSNMPSLYEPPYKLTHKNHPCAIWTRQSVGNYEWLAKLGLELCYEYTYRYGKIHKSQAYIEDLSKNIPNIPDLGFTEPYRVGNLNNDLKQKKYKSHFHVVLHYRKYYIESKKHLHSWKGKLAGRPDPHWI